MQLKIGTTDVTSAVQESTYKIDRKAVYDEWTNANNVTKHSNIRRKISGSFDMVFLPGYSMDYDDFLTILNANTIGDVTTVSLSVNNLDGEVVTINCFFEISFSPIRDTNNGSGIYYKRCTVKLQEC